MIFYFQRDEKVKKVRSNEHQVLRNIRFASNCMGPKKFLQKLSICAIFIGDSKHITLAEKVRYINPYRVIKLLA